LMNRFETITENNIDYNLTKTIGLTEF